MPHLSSKAVDKKTAQKLYRILIDTLTSRDVSRKQHQAFVNELLTSTEKVMIAKRVAAVALIAQGMSPYHTAKTLKLSETTAGKLSNRIESGDCRNIIALCKTYQKGPLGRYIENLLKPLPRYGTSPSSLFKK